MAKLIHIIDSDDFNVIEGYQNCYLCPLKDFEISPGECSIHFNFLFGKSCCGIKVALKPTAKKIKLEHIEENIE